MSDSLLDKIEYENLITHDCNYMDINEALVENQDTSFRVAHLNVHSIPDKYYDLLDLFEIMREKNMLPDVVLFCETFFSEKNFSKYSFDNFDLISRYRKNKSRGGVSILIRSNIKYIERSDIDIFEEGIFESVFIEVQRKYKCNIVIGEIYRIPGTCEREFIEKYKSIVAKIKHENKKIIIGTDQNLDYLKINAHSRTMDFFNLNLENNIIPTIYKPTRVTHTSATLIDNIYIDSDLYKNVKSHILTIDISDHYMCLTGIQEDLLDRNVTESFNIRKVTDSMLRNMNASLSNRNWTILEGMSPNEASEFLINEIEVVMNFYAPEKKIRIKMKNKYSEPWMTQALKVSSLRCRSLYKKSIKKSKESVEFQCYRKYRNLYNTLRRKARFAYYNEIVEKNKSDAKRLWAVLNKITGKLKNKKDISDEIIVNGIKEHNPELISNAFGKHYSELGGKLAEAIKEKVNIGDPMRYMKNKIEQNCFLFPTSQLEIEKIIKSLKNKNSSGYDDISNKMLKRIYPSIIPALEIIFNKSLSSGIFPENMKLAIVKPLYKGKNKTEILNYRPVSLLPVLSKILEKIVYSRIVKFFNKHKVFYEGQYGFRKNRSTIDTILDLTGNILESFNRNHYTLGLFLDMSKAFDSIDHSTLLKKMEFYGIRGTVLSWFKSYLKDRQIRVKFKNNLSDCYFMRYGTPQGSVLGPLLYLILSNDLVKCLKFCNCVVFADDTTLFASGGNLKFLFKKVNDDLQRLSEWFYNNSLTINVDKSMYVLFRRKQKELGQLGNLKMSGIEISRVKSVKFLGIVIDEHLEWNHQVKHVMTKMIAGNYSLSMVKNMVSVKSKLLIYYANVQSHINYALSVWGPMAKAAEINKLIVQQNKSIRLILKVGRRSNLGPLYKKVNLLRIKDQIELDLLKISFRYSNDNLPIRITNLFDLGNHLYETRNRNNLRAPHHTTFQYGLSFLGQAPSLWLNLPEQLKSKNSVRSFIKGFIKMKVTEY